MNLLGQHMEWHGWHVHTQVLALKSCCVPCVWQTFFFTGNTTNTAFRGVGSNVNLMNIETPSWCRAEMIFMHIGNACLQWSDGSSLPHEPRSLVRHSECAWACFHTHTDLFLSYEWKFNVTSCPARLQCIRYVGQGASCVNSSGEMNRAFCG